MEEVEGAQAGEFGCPPVSPEAHDGGRAPGTLHHLIVGGIAKRRIVDDAKDRENFVNMRMGEISLESATTIYACG